MLEVTRKLSGANIGLNMDLPVSNYQINMAKTCKCIFCHVGLEQLLSKTAGKYCVGDEV